MSRKLAWAWGAALLAVVGYFSLTYGGLPERVATHFDAAGNPNGFQGKEDYLVFFLQFISLMNGVFAGLYFLIELIPVQLINMPRKDYWLESEDRKREMFGRIKGVACLLGLFVNLIFLFTTHIIYQANAPNPFFKFPITGGIALILIGVVFLIIFTILLLQPPQKKDAT